MNERIRELAEQAGMRTVSYETDEDTYFTETLDVEKFAELMVKEFCDLIENGIPTSTYTNMIKQHFGVCNEKV